MLVEHSFITTREADDCLGDVDRLLLGFEFTRVGAFDPMKDSRPCPKCSYELQGLPMNIPCPECGVQTLFARRVEYRRGKKSARQAVYRLDRQPQRIFVEFDRGKVSIAASIEPYGKPAPMHSEYLLAVATSIEQAVANTAGPEALERGWTELHKRVKKFNRRKRLPRDIILFVFLGLIALLVAAAVIGAMS